LEKTTVRGPDRGESLGENTEQGYRSKNGDDLSYLGEGKKHIRFCNGTGKEKKQAQTASNREKGGEKKKEKYSEEDLRRRS